MQKKKKSEITPEAALMFLEDFRKLKAGQDEPTQSISLRVPQNILRGFKTQARLQNRPYQSMMIQALREYLAMSDPRYS